MPATYCRNSWTLWSQTLELNVSLTSIGMLWNVSDYFYQNRESFKKTLATEEKDFLSLKDMVKLQPFDRLWMCLYMKLGDFCVDERPAVRKSAGQTLFSTVSAHGGLLHNETWQAVFWQVLFPLLEKVESLSTVASDQKVDANGSILIHHSRNTAQKQWAETEVLTLSGVSRVFNSKQPLLHQLGDFENGWTLLLKHIEKSALSRNTEVSLSALKSLQELLLINTKTGEKGDNQWLQAWRITINIGLSATTPSDNKELFVPSQQFLTSLVLVYPALFQHIKHRFTTEILDSLFGVLNNIISVPVHCDASPFVLPPITENVLTPLQEGILCCIDCIQGSDWVQPNFVPFGEKALSMIVALYRKTANERMVIEENVLTEIIKGIRVPLRLKQSHPSHSSWRIASEALLLILKIGLECIQRNNSNDDSFWVELPITLEQFLFPDTTDCGVVEPNADDSADCKIILLLKEEILKNPTSFPPHFLLSLTKLLNRGSVQSLAFDCGNSVRIREGFAKICFETLLQLSLSGLADFNFSNGDSESQQNHPNGEATNGEDETVANRLAVTALLHRFQDVLKRYVHDVRLGGTCPLPTHRVVEATFVLQAVSTLGRSLQDAELDKVHLQTWHQLIALYPFLVELTEFAPGSVGKSVRDALHTFLTLLTPPQPFNSD
ncbi:protein MON2 homolog isoform X2 [Artemia franciscana]|uniref:protein MON2 homolog isoform X2 n=1 Tax=Artemia franciscana TaxID=6661 RepID=UPI0032DB7F6C